MASILESMMVMADGDNAMRHCVCRIFEFAPYSSRRCLTPGGRGAASTAWLMVDIVFRVQVRCALGHSDAVRVVPK